MDDNYIYYFNLLLLYYLLYIYLTYIFHNMHILSNNVFRPSRTPLRTTSQTPSRTHLRTPLRAAQCRKDEAKPYRHTSVPGAARDRGASHWRSVKVCVKVFVRVFVKMFVKVFLKS